MSKSHSCFYKEIAQYLSFFYPFTPKLSISSINNDRKMFTFNANINCFIFVTF